MRLFIWALVVQYTIIAVGYIMAKNIGQAFYWLGASILTLGVLMMDK